MAQRIFIFIFLFIQVVFSAKCDTVEFFSPSMEKMKKLVVISPEQAKDKRELPAVYLLHGYSGSYRDWPKNINLETLSDQHSVFIICPDGDYNGWYLDSPLQKESQYETHLIKEVIPLVDSLYSTSNTKEGRAVCGLSMGGHGALYLALKHPKLFAAASSMSGVVDLLFAKERWQVKEKLGEFIADSSLWKNHSVLHKSRDFKNQNIQILLDCGVDDFAIPLNRSLHQKMLALKIPHTYIERPGNHSWEYWTNALPYHLLFFSNILKK